MAALFGEQVTLGQANGPDVELAVFGDEQYARYETPSGYSAIYDDAVGLFVYARLEHGAFLSTGVPVSEPPPPDAVEHGQESPEVRRARRVSRRAPDPDAGDR